jgi:hypothetical protein
VVSGWKLINSTTSVLAGHNEKRKNFRRLLAKRAKGQDT